MKLEKRIKFYLNTVTKAGMMTMNQIQMDLTKYYVDAPGNKTYLMIHLIRER